MNLDLILIPVEAAISRLPRWVEQMLLGMPRRVFVRIHPRLIEAPVGIDREQTVVAHKLRQPKSQLKYLVASACVTVTGPPAAICLRKVGITEPSLPSTFPNLTAMNRVDVSVTLLMRRSPRRFVAPMTFVGRTALSVEM